MLMERAGIDTNTFKSHSMRSASTSKAKAGGVSVSDILRGAVWSRESTFERFYHKPIIENGFGVNVLSPVNNINVSFEQINCHI